MIRTNNRTINTIRNISWGLIAKIINIALPFAIRTIIIYKLGADYAGLSGLFTAILEVLSVAELGFASAITFSLYKPVAQNDNKEICEWITLYRGIYRVIGTIILIIGICLLPVIPFLIKGEYPQDINIYLLFGIYLINTVSTYYIFPYKSVILIVYQRRDIISNIDLILLISRNCIQIIALLLCGNYYLYIIWLPIFTIFSNIIINQITNKNFPQIKCNKRINREKWNMISEPVKGAAIGRISLVSRNAFDSIILSAICGLTVVTIYGNYYYIFSSIGAILAVIIQAMTASVGNSVAAEDRQKNVKDHERFDFYYMFIVSWCSICMFCIYQDFMDVWTKGKMIFPFHTMILFCIYFYINHLSEIRSIYSEVNGLWWRFRKITILEMISNFTLNIVLGMIWGVDGILLATIVTAFFSSFIGITIITYRTYFNTSPQKYYLNNCIYIFVGIIVSLVTKFAVQNFIIDGVVSLLIKCVICGSIAGILLFGIYFAIPKFRTYILQSKKIIVMRRNKKDV